MDLDDSSKGWIVSLDYVMTAAVAIVSGQLQVSTPAEWQVTVIVCINDPR